MTVYINADRCLLFIRLYSLSLLEGDFTSDKVFSNQGAQAHSKTPTSFSVSVEFLPISYYRISYARAQSDEAY